MNFARLSPSVRPRLLTGLCWAAMMSLAIGINLLPVFLTTLSELYGGSAGLSKEQLGRLGAAGFAGLVAGILVTGPLADLRGTKVFVLGGNLLIAVSLVGLGYAPDYAALVAWTFCLGLGAGVLDMVLSPVVGALHPGRRAAALNWLHSFYCVGAVVTVLAGTLALRAELGWRASCLLLVPLPLGLVVAFAPLAFPPLLAGGGKRMPLRRLLRHSWFLAALGAIFFGGATELGMAQWLPAYAETELRFPQWVGGTALVLFSVAMALGRMIIGAIGGRIDSTRLMQWACASSVVLFLLASFLPVPGAALAACIAAGFTGSCLWPTMLAVTANRYPEGGATMFGALAALGNAGGIVMPWLVGWIADRSDLRWGLAISALAPTAMAVLLAAMRAGKER